ncbi:MAG: MazG-like family protein [Defluviitaleaceae bacterium]|nr:MazG-like family protein [Defluviitaleaceae bacterium]
MQKQTQQFLTQHNLYRTAATRYIDLVSEVGELGKEILTATAYGKTELQPTASITEEIGDAIFSMMALCCELNINAEAALAKAIEKYQHRFATKGHIASGG